jgi:uncharacterized protein
MEVIGLVFAILLAAYRVLVFRKHGKRTSAALGFAFDRGSLIHFLIGAIIGAIAISTIFGIEWSGGFFQIYRVNALSALRIDWFYFIVKPLLEEFLFRCAILGALLLWIPKKPIALIISAIIFGGEHLINPNASSISVLSTILGGLAYGSAFLAAERIRFPLGLHITWNYCQARVFGFMLSGRFNGSAPFIQQHDLGPALITGGSYGPEGGILGLCARILVPGLIAAWILWERFNSRDREFEKITVQ